MSIITIRNLTKVFRVSFGLKKVHALQSLNLDVEDGEIFGFVGPNGAGKTTTIKIMMGLIYPSEGRVELFGKSCTKRESKYRIGYLPEQPYFYHYLTGREVLILYANLFGIRGKEASKRSEELLELVGLSLYRDIPLGKYSKGMLQRIGLAQALVNDPDLIVLDEPMSGLDPMGRLMVRDIILEMNRKGKTIFFSSHILSDVEMICNRVGIIVNGRLISSGYIHDLVEQRPKFIEITARNLLSEGEEELKRAGYDFTRFKEMVHIRVKDEEEQKRVLAIVGRFDATLVSVIPRRETLEKLLLRKIYPKKDIEGGG